MEWKVKVAAKGLLFALYRKNSVFQIPNCSPKGRDTSIADKDIVGPQSVNVSYFALQAFLGDSCLLWSKYFFGGRAGELHDYICLSLPSDDVQAKIQANNSVWQTVRRSINRDTVFHLGSLMRSSHQNSVGSMGTHRTHSCPDLTSSADKRPGENSPCSFSQSERLNTCRDQFAIFIAKNLVFSCP